MGLLPLLLHVCVKGAKFMWKWHLGFFWKSFGEMQKEDCWANGLETSMQ